MVEATGTGNFLDPDGYLDLLPHSGRRLLPGFRHNCWKHEEDLSLRYVGVGSLSLDADNQSDWASFGAVTLDEILPHEHGCSREIGFLDGSLIVVSRELISIWTEADCPDRLPSS
ncbi:hypothetical protein [Actinophytocola oryzae]|uniref:Uncharacterized protein n=1 Tax=Actinophytocola oryzae TaxID=502181 RepID=A0A4R7V1B1_9PSEU|nr:hypothetical protein [Actinophytocola oryzae]TDV43083.1 hypothetical protein CLV71_11617 [Actinophytocola oryzae]